MTERKYFDYDETELTPAQAAKKRYKLRNREKVLQSAREYARKRYHANLERERERHIQWKKNNPEKYSESQRKSQKKKYDNLSKEEKKEFIRKTHEWQKKNPEKRRIYRERWREKNKEKYLNQAKKQSERSRERYPEKCRARILVRTAVKTGFLIRPSECSKCGEDKMRIEGHHHDYNKPLDVIWLCTKCHREEHKRLKEEEKNIEEKVCQK